MEYMKTKTGRMVTWVVLNFGLLLGLILGTAYELNGVLNIVLFTLWVFAFVSWSYFVDSITDKVIEENDYFMERPYPVHETLFWGYDVALLMTLAYTGHFVLAFVYIIAVIGQVTFYKKIEDLRNKSEKYT